MQFNWNIFGAFKNSNPAPYNCERVQRLLSLYVDSMTSSAERIAIDAHITDCAACRQQSACLRSIHEVVSSRPIAEPPSDLRMRIAQAIAAERTPVRTAHRIRVSYGLLAGAATLVVCFTVVGLQVERMQVARNVPTKVVGPLEAHKYVNTVVNPRSLGPLKIVEPIILTPTPSKVANNVVPDNNDEISTDSVQRRLNAMKDNHGSSLETITPVHVLHLDLKAPTQVVIRSVVKHNVVLDKHEIDAPRPPAPSDTQTPPVVASLPPKDQTNVAVPIPAPAAPPQATVAVAQADTHPAARTADFLQAIKDRASADDLKSATIDYTPYRVIHSSVQAATGTLAIVGTDFK